MSRREIREYFDGVYLLERDLEPNSAYTFRLSLGNFATFHGGRFFVDEFCDEMVSRWIKHLQDCGSLAPRSIRSKRGNVLTLWKFAFERGDCQIPPARVRKVKCPELLPEALLPEEFSRLRAHLDNLPGYLANGVPRRLYFGCIGRFTYESGLRRGDVWRFTPTQLRDDGVILLGQHKTRQAHTARVEPETVALFQEIVRRLRENGEDAAYPLAWRWEPRGFYYWFNQAKELAGIAKEDALQLLRRTGATQCYIADPGSATRYCGHKTPGLALRNYVDRSQAVRPVSPPRIE